MSKERQDAWSEENDLLLADTVLRHIREGSTQLKAFEEVGDRLNRTSAACGFRWNAIVRDQYAQAIEIAKKQRKQRRKMASLHQTPEAVPAPTQNQQTPPATLESEKAPEENAREEQDQHEEGTPQAAISQNAFVGHSDSMTMNDVIHFLSRVENEGLSSEHLKLENERLERETERLQRENAGLQKQFAQLKKENQTIKEDYQSVIQIMDRARKMVVLGEEEENTPSFKMDKNGNLEKVAKTS